MKEMCCFYQSQAAFVGSNSQLQIPAQGTRKVLNSFPRSPPHPLSPRALCQATLLHTTGSCCHCGSATTRIKQAPSRSRTARSTSLTERILSIKSSCFYQLCDSWRIGSTKQSGKANVLQIRRCSSQHITAPKLLTVKNEVSQSCSLLGRESRGGGKKKGLCYHRLFLSNISMLLSLTN